MGLCKLLRSLHGSIMCGPQILDDEELSAGVPDLPVQAPLYSTSAGTRLIDYAQHAGVNIGESVDYGQQGICPELNELRIGQGPTVGRPQLVVPLSCPADAPAQCRLPEKVSLTEFGQRAALNVDADLPREYKHEAGCLVALPDHIPALGHLVVVHEVKHGKELLPRQTLAQPAPGYYAAHFISGDREAPRGWRSRGGKARRRRRK